jgi:hypothetical protein
MIALLLVACYLLLFASNAYAVCPACTVAVGAGVGLSRWLGIDDTITGLWIGGFLISSSLWFDSYLESRKIKFPRRTFLLVLIFYLVTVFPLYFTGIVGHPYNKIWGIDKLIFGTGVGSVLFLASIFLDKYLRAKNGGKVFFYYQKVVLPVALLLLGSGVFYFLTK